MSAESRCLLSALWTRTSASLGLLTVGELVFGPDADLELLRQVATGGSPRERAAAVVVLDAIGHPVDLALDDELLVVATATARSRP